MTSPFNLSTRVLEGQLPATTGSVYFVDSATGNANGDGTSLRPFDKVSSVIAAATGIGLTAGDTIVCLPGHTETISSATTLTMSVAGVKVLGLGTGSLRPTFTFTTAATATINVTAANVSVENCLFVANFADVASAFTLTTATDFRVVDCEFRDTTAILNFVNLVDTNATSNNADGLTLLRCRRIGAGATTATAIIKMDGTNSRLTVRDCYFAHLAVTAAGFMPIAAGKIVTNAIIDRNVFNLVGATDLTTGTLITTNQSTNSGVIMNNYVQNLDATSEILVTASSGFVFFENKSSGAADKSGYILPAVDS